MNLEKYGRAGLATDDITTESIRFALWITNAIDTH